MLKHSNRSGFGSFAVVISLVILAGLTACTQPGQEKPKADPTPDVEYAMPSLLGTWSSVGPPMVTLTVEADDSYSLTVNRPPTVGSVPSEVVYSGTISVTATAISITITAGTRDGMAFPADALLLIAGPYDFDYKVTVTDTATSLTVMGAALLALVDSTEVTLQKQS